MGPEGGLTPQRTGLLTVGRNMTWFFIIIYNLNQQSEFTFYKLMWLLQCLDGESSSGESPVP
jgi:hypothetical protein